jgi:hypothetical protein
MSHKTFYGEEFFPEEKAKDVLTYKYAGSDNSVLYKYIYGPFAQFLVDKVIPEWLA